MCDLPSLKDNKVPDLVLTCLVRKKSSIDSTLSSTIAVSGEILSSVLTSISWMYMSASTPEVVLKLSS